MHFDLPLPAVAGGNLTITLSPSVTLLKSVTVGCQPGIYHLVYFRIVLLLFHHIHFAYPPYYPGKSRIQVT